MRSSVNTPTLSPTRLIAAVSSAVTLAELMADVDNEDAQVYLAMHDDDAYVERVQARHYAEVMADRGGWEYAN